MAEPDIGSAASRPRLGLSGKLLGLTVLFVMLAEVLIYVPSIANFRERWLEDRLARARTVALVLQASPDGMVSPSLTRELLGSVGARMVVLQTGDTRQLLAVSDAPDAEAVLVDLRARGAWIAISEAFGTLATPSQRTLRVVGTAPMGGEYVEVVVDERPLKEAMLAFSGNILLLSLVISGITACLVYLTLHRMIVRPVRRLTANMLDFGLAPADASRIVVPSDRADEVGVAERELAAMQRQLQGELQSKARLAALGLAVSKINHDLRNLLASAQLVSERLGQSSDPMVRRLSPKLIATIERAVDYCGTVLAFGKAQERPPERAMVRLDAVAREVEEAVTLGRDTGIAWVAAIEPELEVDADPEHLFRVLVNLARNAVQAMEARPPTDPARDQLRIAGRRESGVVVIEVSDTGPGLTPRARQHLFEAFHGSTRAGGTGLGLAIAAELVRAHGGSIAHVDGTMGATFRITIPDRPVDLAAHRRSRQAGHTNRS